MAVYLDKFRRNRYRYFHQALREWEIAVLAEKMPSCEAGQQPSALPQFDGVRPYVGGASF